MSNDADVAGAGDRLGRGGPPPRGQRLDKQVWRVRMGLGGSVGLLIHEHVKRPSLLPTSSKVEEQRV